MTLATESGRQVGGYAHEVLGTVTIDTITTPVIVTVPRDVIADQTGLTLSRAVLHELRAIRILLAQAQGQPGIFDPLPQI